jgi:outer membrane protein OmpA-like peptidoglycan-associated protein
MKRSMTFALRPKRLVVLLGAVGISCAHVQAADRGRMIDNASVFTQPLPSSSERDLAAFAGRSPSALTVEERRTMLETPPPAGPAVQTTSLHDTLGGTNFDSGKAELLPRARAALDALVARVKGKQAIRFEIVGHTDNQRIAAWLKPTFPDNAALSRARALAVAAYLKDALGLPATSFSVAGRGETEPVADNGTPEGMARNRRTEIHVWYEEVATTAPQPAAAAPREVVTKVTRDACASAPQTLQPFSISVDGQRMLGASGHDEENRERCVDVALERADIQVKYDPMNVSPALNVWTTGAAVRRQDVGFATYTNYAWWLRRAEVRVFLPGQDRASTPLAVVPLAVGGNAAWTVPAEAPDQLVYVLRVYDADGRFDETAPHVLAVVERASGLPAQAKSGWGETTLARRNIRAAGGTVTVSGTGIRAGQSVTALGLQVPVDAKGNFALRQILPAGPHTVQVDVRDPNGLGRTFSRNLSIADEDWFYVAVADLTAGRDNTSGPAKLVTGDDQHYDSRAWVDGRAAFYLKGKVKGDYLLTASADTREQPLRDMFSNFASKDPYYLLRRIDPDRYYPVYGDDSTIVDDAPTSGKLYVRLARQDSSVMWGNFQTAWTGTELTQFNRGLYGANAQWNSADVTAAGDKRHSVNVFAAEPGTLPMREEFRGTGGSLYYLHQQDVTQGSERLWIEVRDRDSGLVIERRALVPAQDYDVNYLQGRVTLRTPLSSTGEGSSLFRTSSLGGNPVYLVATYEYVPGLSAVHGNAAGVRASSWLNDHVGVGLTAYHQGEHASSQGLQGLDTTLRATPNTWLRAEAARSRGAAGNTLVSSSGGFDSDLVSSGGGRADARRVQLAADLADVGARGSIAGYWQDRGAGFAGPGQIAAAGEAVRQQGLRATVPLGDATEASVAVDDRDATSQTSRSAEAALRHKLSAEWGVSGGLRTDDRQNGVAVPTASPLMNQYGRRNDAIVRFDFRPLAQDAASGDGAEPTAAAPAAAAAPVSTSVPATSLMATPGVGQQGVPRRSGAAVAGSDGTVAAGVAAARLPGLRYADWSMYGFVQHTLSHSGDRSLGDRAGVGGSWQASERVQVNAEASGGSGGGGGQLGATYKVSERSDIYLAYTLETEVPDVNYGGRSGTLTGGSHYRLSDQATMFAESRWQNGAGPQSLTHAFGVDLAPAPQWSLGVKAEVGTLSDPLAGDIRRRAIGITAGYHRDQTRFTTGLEYRTDRTTSTAGTLATTSFPQGPVAGTDNRRSWLLRNSLGVQVDPAWRLLGKFNYSRSISSQGAFYDGDYTEGVLGAAYRPIDNDRWNALVKYTYFYNLPASSQVDSTFGTPLDYKQKSHVFNGDVTWDVRPWVSVGAKYGLRVGQVTGSRTSNDWFDSHASLVVLRTDWHWVREWDAVTEVRRLAVREARDARKGALVGLYRHVGEHAKLGIGYNFTDFSDDLTDMSYRSRGWFINALGTF